MFGGEWNPCIFFLFHVENYKRHILSPSLMAKNAITMTQIVRMTSKYHNSNSDKGESTKHHAFVITWNPFFCWWKVESLKTHWCFVNLIKPQCLTKMHDLGKATAFNIVVNGNGGNGNGNKNQTSLTDWFIITFILYIYIYRWFLFLV